jgi:hypothetical protein
MVAHAGYSVAGRSGGREVRWCRVRSVPCTWRRGARVSWLSLKTKVGGLWVVWTQNHSDSFSLVWASKPMATVCEWFGLKTTRTVFTELASKPVATASSGLTLKHVATVFSGLASKSRWWRVSQFGSQNWQLWFGDLGLKIIVTVS